MMRIILQAAFSCFIWPALVMAQGSPSPSPAQSDAPAQSPAQSPGAASPDPATTANPTPWFPAPVQPAVREVRPIKEPPHPSGYAPVLKFSAGYAITSVQIPSAGRVALSGADFGVSVDSSERF